MWERERGEGAVEAFSLAACGRTGRTGPLCQIWEVRAGMELEWLHSCLPSCDGARAQTD